MEKSITIGIVGCGFIGGALKRWVEEHNPVIKVVVSDPPKGFNDSMDQADVVFVSIHIPTEANGTQDLTLLKQIIKGLPDKPIFVRTTVLPGTTAALSRKFNKHVYFMPEFLTERTAYENFCHQPMVFTAEFELLKRIFKGKKYTAMTSLEAEVTKYAHNVFGAVKVTYFNCVADYCRRLRIDYQHVLQGCLLSGYINDVHTAVPGPDGKLGYGGKCFPKDVNSFSMLTKDTPLGTFLAPIHNLNVGFRGCDK